MRRYLDRAPTTVWAYACLLASWHVYMAVPGGAHYPDGSQGFWLLLDLALVGWLVRGSAVAWRFSVFFAAIGVLGVYAGAFASFDLEFFAVSAFMVTQLALLLAVSTRRHVGGGRPLARA